MNSKDHQDLKDDASGIPIDLNKPFYILNLKAVKTEVEARILVAEIESRGEDAGYLWIPDCASLSGAKYYSVFIGPYFNQEDCEIAVENFRLKDPNAYGLLVSQEKKRVQIYGIGNANHIDPGDFNSYGIPSNAIEACGGWWADGGEYYYLLRTDQGIDVYY